MWCCLWCCLCGVALLCFFSGRGTCQCQVGEVCSALFRNISVNSQKTHTISHRGKTTCQAPIFKCVSLHRDVCIINKTTTTLTATINQQLACIESNLLFLTTFPSHERRALFFDRQQQSHPLQRTPECHCHHQQCTLHLLTQKKSHQLILHEAQRCYSRKSNNNNNNNSKVEISSTWIFSY